MRENQAEDHSLEEATRDVEVQKDNATTKRIHMKRMIITMSHLTIKGAIETVHAINSDKTISMELVLIQLIVMLK
jgi:hypothetical protein